MTLTAPTGYIEDFQPGQQVQHRRGHTVCEADNQMLSLLTMNTAQTHFNQDSMTRYMDGAFDRMLLNACVALAIGVGLTSQDMSENSLADLGYHAFRMPAPVFVGDTLYATSTVVSTDTSPRRDDAGELVYDIEVRNVQDVLVLSVRRTVLLKSRAAWARKDETESAARTEPAAILLRAAGAENQ